MRHPALVLSLAAAPPSLSLAAHLSPHLAVAEPFAHLFPLRAVHGLPSSARAVSTHSLPSLPVSTLLHSPALALLRARRVRRRGSRFPGLVENICGRLESRREHGHPKHIIPPIDKHRYCRSHSGTELHIRVRDFNDNSVCHDILYGNGREPYLGNASAELFLRIGVDREGY